MAITNVPNVVVTNPRVDGELDGLNLGRVETYTEGASQSFKSGEFVILSSGKIVTATPGSTPITGPADVWGIAMQDASGVTDNPIKVFVLNPGAYVVMALADLSAVDTGNYLEPAVANIGTTVSVVKETSTGKWVANVNSAGTNKSFVIVKVVPRRSADKIDSTKSFYGAQVVCRLLQSAVQYEA